MRCKVVSHGGRRIQDFHSRLSVHEDACIPLTIGSHFLRALAFISLNNTSSSALVRMCMVIVSLRVLCGVNAIECLFLGLRDGSIGSDRVWLCPLELKEMIGSSDHRAQIASALHSHPISSCENGPLSDMTTYQFCWGMVRRGTFSTG